MKKRLIIIGIIVIAIAAIGTKYGTMQTETTETSTGSIAINPVEYTVGTGLSSTTKVYGNVVASNLASIVTSTQGNISSLQCQPGKKVKKGAIVATITPANDLQKENSLIQQGFLQQQLNLSQGGVQSTLNNIDIQSVSLQNQLSVQQQNLANLQRQKALTSGDNKLQIANAEKALANLTTQYNLDIERTDNSIKNQEKSLQNSIANALTLFDQTFGITNPGKNYNAEAYLGARNQGGKDTLKIKFPGIKERNAKFTTMSNEDARQFMTDATDFFSLAAQVMADSIADADYLPQAKLDSLYATFTNTANALLTTKTNFDNLIASYDTIKTTYDTQKSSAQTNLDSLKSNKTAISDITLDSQINALELSVRAVQDQIKSLGNNKNLQTQQAQSQLLNNQQSLELLQNSLQGETLYSPFDGIVKSVNVQMSNKVTAGALVCQITPTEVESVKIQIFSSDKIPYGTDIYFYDQKDVLIASGVVTLELPYRDSLTQNYIYEFSDPSLDLKEGTKLKIQFDEHFQNDEVWIPLSYITPKLEGYFVKKKYRDGAQDIQVEVGDIDNGTIRILSGLQHNDIITK